jgi:hypothetical protein
LFGKPNTDEQSFYAAINFVHHFGPFFKHVVRHPEQNRMANCRFGTTTEISEGVDLMSRQADGRFFQ